MNRQIKSINSLYEFILKNRKNLLSEADISGIDELVYNPATGPGGTIGHGYDGGKKVNGIKWSGHDDHLHIGFTNRDVAMQVIDYADKLGLKTTENPYAKRDPNKKVDKVHAKKSFHYRIFPGEPVVGAGVDISGDQKTITNLIKWIEENFAGKSFGEDPTKDTDDNFNIVGVTKDSSVTTSSSDTSGSSGTSQSSTSSDPLLYNLAMSVGKMIGLKEDFGRNVTKKLGSIIIPGSSNPRIKSPVDGKVDNVKFITGCKNQINIEFNIKGNKYFLQFCGVSKRLVSDKQSVSEGQVIATMNSDEDAEVLLLDSSYYRQPLDPNTFDDKYKEEKEKNKERSKERFSNERRPAEKTYHDPALAMLLNLPSRIFGDKYDKEGNLKTKMWAEPTAQRQADPWIKDLVTAPFKKIGKMFKEEDERKIKKLNENIDKIKNLLK